MARPNELENPPAKPREAYSAIGSDGFGPSDGALDAVLVVVLLGGEVADDPGSRHSRAPLA